MVVNKFDIFCRRPLKRHGNWKKRNEESKNSKKRQKENRKKL